MRLCCSCRLLYLCFIYLNQFIKYAREGKFKGLNNEKLKEFGSKQKFYPGIPEFFQESKALIENDPTYKEYGILVEHYIVSTGMAAVIRGSAVAEHVAGIWGCELLDGKTDTGDTCLLYTSPSPRDRQKSRMPSSA